MHIVWFSWKDIKHPEAGGAEIVSDQVRTRLVADGHKVTLITAHYPGSQKQEIVAGVRVLRSGGRFSVYSHAKKLYKSIQDPVDMTIDEMNTIPFMVPVYSKHTKNVLLTYQLARSVWFYQIAFPLSLIGYAIEPMYLRFLSKKYISIMTESDSTKHELQRYGFPLAKISVFRVGTETKPLKSLSEEKSLDSVIFLGALRPMKRPLDAIRAFELARDKNNKLTMSVAGNDHGRYAQKVRDYIAASRHANAIRMHGRVSVATKLALLKKSSVILVTSVKEGWGLIATEASGQGTPVIAYDADGLRDSVVDGQTGRIVASGDVESLGKAINELLSDKETYTWLRKNAYEHSKQFTFENSYADFVKGLGIKPTK